MACANWSARGLLALLLLLGLRLPALAAITHVADRVMTFAQAVDSAASTAFTPGAGNLLVVTVHMWANVGTPAMVVSDSVNGTYTQAFVRIAAGDPKQGMFQFYKNNVAASSTVVTVNPTPATAWFQATISEFTGQETTTAVLDTTATTTGLSTSSSTVSLTTAAPSVASNAVVAGLNWTTGTRTITPGGTMTQIVELENGGPGFVNYMAVARAITTTATAITAAWTVSGGAVDGNIGIGVYRAAGGVVIPPTVVLAFPSAEGAGQNALGGRGGRAYNINSLSYAAGSGGSCNAGGCGGSAPFTAGTVTLLDCITDRFAVGPRTCIFRTGGTIDLGQNSYPAMKPYLTIAGQTAPGDGILIRNGALSACGGASCLPSVHNIIMRHLRIGNGDNGGFSGIDISIYTAHEVILDHLSLRWSTDDTFNGISGSYNVTLQWSIITDGLTNSPSNPGQTSKAASWNYTDDQAKYSMLHNLMANVIYRAPSLNSGQAQIVNNVIYNIQDNGSAFLPQSPGGSALKVDFIKNYYLPGPNTKSEAITYRNRIIAYGLGVSSVSNATFVANSQLCVQDNYHSEYRPLGTEPQTALVVFLGSPTIPVVACPTQTTANYSVVSAAQARIDVLAKAGAYAVAGGIATVRRDTVDARTVTDVGANTGRQLQLVPTAEWNAVYAAGTPYVDTDGDGIADAWEDSHSLNKNDAADGPAISANGYTNLENFINELAGDTIPPPPAAALLVSPSASGQPLRATVVHIEGVSDTWRVTDKDGKIVEVHVPAQSMIDIQTSKEEQPGASGTAGQVRGTVPATVVAVDTLTNRVKVRTPAGQVIELDTATKDRQIGEQVTLIIPR